MNWTEIAQSQNPRVWQVAEIKQFPEGQADRFIGASIGQLQEKIIFSGSELFIAFWAVNPDEPITIATLYESEKWFAQAAPQPSRLDLRNRFPNIPHADRSSFSFLIKLDETKQEQLFDIYIDFAEERLWFANIRLVNYLSTELTPAHLNPPGQVNFLHQWAKRKNSLDNVADTCAKLIGICGEKTAPAIFAILGDTFEAKKLIDPAIAAYRKAVELQPQESKFEMRLSQLLAQRTPDTQATGTPKGISLSTSGDTALTIIVDMLYRSTPSYMYARELFQNELDAIYRRWDKELELNGQSDFTGTVRIEPDAQDPKKLCFWGDGIGMTFDQVTNHLAKLVNSGNVAHTSGNAGEPSSPSNFGIGAKTSALPENTLGMVYKTLPFGEPEGIEFVMWKNPDTFLYEIKAWNNGDQVEHFRRIPVQDFAEAIRRRGSGASATLLGNTPEEDTFKKSENLLTRQVAKQQIRQGVVYFLNSRYFTMPAAGIDVKVAERGDGDTLQWHTVLGQKAFLDRYAEQKGRLPISVGGLQADAHWWILSEQAKQEATAFNSLGHIGLLWKNELYYNPNEAQRSQRIQLNGFGIHFGEERVVIYIEPTQPDLVDSHPSRTKLMYKHRELNPSEFGERFANNMPPELAAYQKSFFSPDITGESIEKIRDSLELLGVHKEAKMREYAAAFFNRGKTKPTPTVEEPKTAPEKLKETEKTESAPTNPEEIKPEDFRSHIPNCIWRNFDAETVLFAAEWDNRGYVIKFNSAWPQYQNTLKMLVEDAQADYPDMLEMLLQQECEKQLRFEYFKTLVETLFGCYSMMAYSSWTDRAIETQLLSPAGLSVALQFNSNLRANVKAALADTFIKKPEEIRYGLKLTNKE